MTMPKLTGTTDEYVVINAQSLLKLFLYMRRFFSNFQEVNPESIKEKYKEIRLTHTELWHTGVYALYSYVSQNFYVRILRHSKCSNLIGKKHPILPFSASMYDYQFILSCFSFLLVLRDASIILTIYEVHNQMVPK